MYCTLLTGNMRSLVNSLAICAIFVWVPALGKPVENSEWIELSYPFNSETIYWPTVVSFHHSLVFENYTADGYYYASYDISASEHGGTHIDAPRHFAAGKWTTDQIPLDHLIGPAIKIDLSTKADKVKFYNYYQIKWNDKTIEVVLFTLQLLYLCRG